MSGPTELRIAEMLKEGASYVDIRKAQRVGADTIKSVKDMVTSGIIAFDDQGKAFIAKPAQKNIEDIHAQVMGVVTKKATEEALMNAEDDYALGNEIRQYWNLKAQEAGLGLREFVKAALIFYDEYKDELENMRKQAQITRWAINQLRGNMLRRARMELYYKFVRYCLFLKEKGMAVTPELVRDFYLDLAALETGGSLRIEKRVEGAM